MNRLLHSLTVGVAFLYLAVAPSAFSEPRDRSIKAFEEAQAAALKRATLRVDESLKQRRSELDLLAKPFHKNEKIVLRRNKPNLPDVPGTLYAVVMGDEPYVKIAERRINLVDIHEVDRQRLLLGDMPEDKFRQEIQKLNDEFELLRNKTIEAQADQLLEISGYDPAFLKTTIRFGGYFWKVSDLGGGQGSMIIASEEQTATMTLPAKPAAADGTAAEEAMTAKVKIDPYNELYSIALFSPFGKTPCTFIVLINGKPVASSYTAEGPVVPTDTPVAGIKFQILRADLPVLANAASAIELKVYKAKVGRWSLVGNKDSAKISTDSNTSNLVTFPFSLNEKSLKQMDDAYGADFKADIEAVRAYQATVTENLATQAKRYIDKARADIEQDALDAIERAAREERERAAAELIAKFDDRVVNWYHAGNPPQDDDFIDSRKCLTEDEIFGDYSLPVKLKDRRVLRVSKWTLAPDSAFVDREKGINVIGVSYRYVLVAGADMADAPAPEQPEEPTVGPDGAPVAQDDLTPEIKALQRERNREYLIQYNIIFVNNNQTAIRFTPVVTITWEDGNKVVMSDAFKVLGYWNGNLLGTHFVPVQLVINSPVKLEINPLPTKDVIDAAIKREHDGPVFHFGTDDAAATTPEAAPAVDAAPATTATP